MRIEIDRRRADLCTDCMPDMTYSENYAERKEEISV